MTQYSRATLDPNTHGGTFLATELNGWAAALLSNHKGASRPSYAVDGMIWHKAVSSTVVEIYFFDGSDDILIGTVNPTANSFVPAGVPAQIPVGIGPLPWHSNTPPTGWVLAYGQALSRTTYAALFAVLGTTYGIGDGSTTFNMPDWRGRLVSFRDNMGGSAAGRLTSTVMSPDGNTVGAVGGSQTHTQSGSEVGSHTHDVNTRNNATAFSSSGVLGNVTGGSSDTNATTSGGSGSPMPIVQPCMIQNAIYYAGV